MLESCQHQAAVGYRRSTWQVKVGVADVSSRKAAQTQAPPPPQLQASGRLFDVVDVGKKNYRFI